MLHLWMSVALETLTGAARIARVLTHEFPSVGCFSHPFSQHPEVQGEGITCRSPMTFPRKSPTALSRNLQYDVLPCNLSRISVTLIFLVLRDVREGVPTSCVTIGGLQNLS